MRTYVANGCTKRKGMTAKERVMYVTLTTGQDGMQQLHHRPCKSVPSRSRRVGRHDICNEGGDALASTPPWRIRLKARVDLGDQTAEFIPFEVIRTAILGINLRILISVINTRFLSDALGWQWRRSAGVVGQGASAESLNHCPDGKI